MGQLSPILRTVEGGHLAFYCPGCESMHMVRVEGPHSWRWNKDILKPTFTPSVLVTGGCKTPGHDPKQGCWCTYAKLHPEETAPFTCTCCHSYVTDGQIHYLHDCTHDLKGQTVDMLPTETLYKE